MNKTKTHKFYYKSLAPTPYSSLWLWQRSQLKKKKSFYFLDHTQPSSEEDLLVNQAASAYETHNDDLSGLSDLDISKSVDVNLLSISEFFKIIDISDNKSLVVIKKNQVISHFLLTLGEVEVVVISGSVSILGFNVPLGNLLTVSTGFASYSITFDLLAYHSYANIDELEKCLKNYDLALDLVSNFLVEDTVVADCIIILFEKWNCPSLLLLKMLLTPFIPSDDWFKINFNQPRLLFTQTLKDIAYNVYHDQTTQAIFDPNCSSIIQQDAKIVFCGGKNAGKSSSLRYFANLLFSAGLKKVYVFDCDPGQTEFSPPGQISIVQITQPLLNPPFVNIMRFNSNIILSSSVASISVNNNPDLYLINFRYLWSSFLQLQESNVNHPVLINTMGWTQDIGCYLLIDMLRFIKPTHVIEIKFNNSECKDNFTFDICPQNVNAASGWSLHKRVEETLQDKPLSTYLETIDYKYIKLSTVWRSSRSGIAKMNRIKAQLAYVCKINELIFKPLLDLDCHKLNYSKIYFHIEYEFPIEPHLILDALELAWVQLCYVGQCPAKSDQCNVLDDLAENFCLGSAMVRNIDRNEKTIHLITSEPLEKLEKVNCIIKPYGITIPNQLMDTFVGSKK